MQKKKDLTLRIRFRVPAGDRIGIDEKEVTIKSATGHPEIILKAGGCDETIRQSDWLILRSSGWDCEEAAKAAAEHLMDALRRSHAYHDIGADLGIRSPKGAFTRVGLKWLEKTTGRPTLSDVHGFMVFPTSLRPMFARAGVGSIFRTVQRERWIKTFLSALESRVPLSERERTAFDLFNAAHTAQGVTDARFVLLFAAIETLLEDRPRPEPVANHIDRLITLTKDANLDRAEKTSILGTLNWMRSHSIRSSGRRFVRQRLGDRQYQDRSAEGLFLNCYDMRNRLLHGGKPFPTRDEVSALVGPLGQMVGHLLAGPLTGLEI